MSKPACLICAASVLLRLLCPRAADPATAQQHEEDPAGADLHGAYAANTVLAAPLHNMLPGSLASAGSRYLSDLGLLSLEQRTDCLPTGYLFADHRLLREQLATVSFRNTSREPG